MEEQAVDLGRELGRQYGQAVAVEYVDVLSPQMSEYPNTLLLIRQRGLPLPVISVNGQPRFAGGVSLEMIGKELDKLGVARLEGLAEG